MKSVKPRKTISSHFELNEKPMDPKDLLGDFPFSKNEKRIEYMEASCAFDIETTSFYRSPDGARSSLRPQGKGWEKTAAMYAWVFGIDGKVCVGRTWGGFLSILDGLSAHYNLNPKSRRMIVYVHNFSFEFQFLKDRIKWDHVFAMGQRDPLFAVTEGGVEFRCSYHLFGYSLATVGKHLLKYPVRKMVGDLDYSLLRNQDTPLSEKEWTYIIHDGLVVMAAVEEERERLGGIGRIPLTKTGYVRRYARGACLYASPSHKVGVVKYERYQDLMKACTIKSLEEYRQLKRGFQGGFTHADAWAVGKTIRDVESFDFRSSYPAAMISEQFPMGPGKRIEVTNQRDFDYYRKRYCCLFDLELWGVVDSFQWDHYLSLSKCWQVDGAVVDNGRIVTADHLRTTITEVDYSILEKTYSWRRKAVANFRIYPRAPLPRDFAHAILDLYKKKTELKHVKGMEQEYQHSKEQLNSCYGMTVTDIVKDESTYEDGEWTVEKADPEKSLIKYNKAKNRFLFYPWGVWVTAYARRNLWRGIFECGSDYLYSDTDSVKICNAKNHADFFRRYDESITAKIRKNLEYWGLDPDLASPKTVEGIPMPLGTWDNDAHYRRFKTLGAKRYIDEDGGGISITVAGVAKSGAAWLVEKGKKEGKDPFDLFDEGLVFDEEGSGKNLHTYIDDPVDCVLTDYLGHAAPIHELSGTHLEPTTYDMSLSASFVDYLMGIREIS